MSAVQASAATPRPKPESRTYTVPEAAAYLRVGVQTVRRMIASGQLAALRVHSRGTGERTHYRVPISELERVEAEAVERAEAQRARKRGRK